MTTKWTQQDQKQLDELTARKAAVIAIYRQPLVSAIEHMPEATVKAADWLITHADTIRDLLEPYDSGIRLAKPASDWIEWAGGACPVHTLTRVDVKHRGGEIYYNERALSGTHAIHWEHGEFDSDIVSYRVCE